MAELEALLKDQLPAEEQATLETHLAECERCRAALETMAGGAEDMLKHAGRDALVSSPRLEVVMEQLKIAETVRITPRVVDPLLTSGSDFHQFGDYEILEELGRGGMGVVFKARQASLKRNVALKLILNGQLASSAEVRRFRTEAEAAAKLDHPNIVPIYEVGEREGRHYFSMKLVEGCNLAALIPAGEFAAQPNPAQTVAGSKRGDKSTCAAQLLAVIARAVHYAHQRGVLHRDLKPGNILIDAEGQPHLTDFGLAKMMESQSQLTHTAAVMGTPNYMAPEQAAGRTREITVAADVFSLGTILYELLAGEPPFNAPDAATVLHRVIHAESPPPSAVTAGIPHDLDTICLKCLEKAPAQRYSSALALAEDLERFLRHEPILARPVGRAEKVWRWCRREPALATAVFTLAAVLVGVAVGSFAFALRLEDARQSEAQERLRAEAMLTRLEIDRAHSFFDDGNSSRAIATLAHVLRRSPTNHVAAARLVSALTHRNFPFPVQSLAADSKVLAAEFTAAGRQVVTVSEDGLVQRWDADSGSKAGEPVKVGNGLTSASFDRHHDSLAVGAARNLQVWNLRDNRRSAMIRQGPEDPGNFESVDLSPDGKRVLALIRSKVNSTYQVIVYDAATAAKLAIARHDKPVESARFGPDGQHFVTTSSSGVRVWESSDGSLRLGPLRHTGVRTAEFSPDGKWIVSGANNKTTKVWDLKTGHERINFSAGHEFWIQSAKFSQDGAKIITASADTTARLWETATGRALMEPLRHLAPVTSATFQPDAQRVLTVAGDIVTIWDVRPRAAAPAAMVHDAALQAMEFSPAGTLLATVAKDRTLRLWNPRTGAQIGPPLPLPDAPTSLVFSPDGRRLAVACANGEVRVWRVTDGLEALASLKHEPPEPMRAWGFTRDGRHLLTTVTKSASLWSLDEQPVSRVEFTNNFQLSAARLSPDGRRVVTASNDKTAQLWDAHTGARVGQLMVHGDFVHDAEFNADSSLLVTATRDGEARVFDGRDGRPVTDKLRHDAHVRTASFSPDGLRVITASRDRTARVWDARTGSPLLELPPAADEFQSARFSPHGRLVLTSTIDHRAQVWDAFTGQAISEVFTHTLERNFATRSSFAPRFAPDSLRIAAASDANAVRVWSLPELPAAAPAWLMELAESLAGTRYDGQGYREFSGFTELVRLRESLQHQPDSDGYSRWAKWFFADPSTRPPGPE